MLSPVAHEGMPDIYHLIESLQPQGMGTTITLFIQMRTLKLKGVKILLEILKLPHGRWGLNPYLLLKGWLPRVVYPLVGRLNF